MNQSSFKGICMIMLVQHFCTSVLHSVIMSALHGSLISNDSWLSAAAINPQLKYRPGEVWYWAEPTPNRRRPKQRDMLLLLYIINEPKQWSCSSSTHRFVSSNGCRGSLVREGKRINNNVGTIKWRRQEPQNPGASLPPPEAQPRTQIIDPAILVRPWMPWATGATFSGCVRNGHSYLRRHQGLGGHVSAHFEMTVIKRVTREHAHCSLCARKYL